MATKIQLRRDTGANWTATNPVLAEGEVGIDLSNNRMKVGDGAKDWKTLQYTAGDAAIWSRTGTVVSPTAAGDTVQISAGTALQPGLTPVGEAATGIYSPGAGQLAISAAGKQAVVVSASGRIGIGGNGTGNNLGVYLQNGGGSNSHFYEASDGTRTMIAGVDSSNDYIKIGALSSHPLGFITANGERLRCTPSGTVLVGKSSVVTGSAALFQTSTTINVGAVATYADNTAAKAGGLVAGDVYRTATGQLMITF